MNIIYILVIGILGKTQAYFLPPLQTTEAFFFPIGKYVFNDSLDMGIVKYRASLESMPDLPEWMNYVLDKESEEGYLYGVPNLPGEFSIQVVASNTEYRIQIGNITLRVEERDERAKNEVEMRFSNFNVEDMFQNNRLDKVVNIIRKDLWNNNEDVYVTLVTSVVKMGGRLPLNPRDKEGVVVKVGSTADFSEKLILLEEEVRPIKNREPCPKDYKRTSAENYFRDEFIPYWCGFKLHSQHTVMPTDKDPIHSPIHLMSDDFNPPSFLEPRRDLLLEFILSVIVPVTSMMMLLIVLSYFMCCYREGIEKSSKGTSSIQMVRYASIHRASNNLRSLATKRDGPCPVGTTPTSTLPRSYTSSPGSTLAKSATLKKLDEKSVLTRQAPPPYTPTAVNYPVGSLKKPH